jgi:hypothetical protein
MVECGTINKYSKFDEIEVGNKEFETYNFTEAEKTNLKNDLSLNVCEITDSDENIENKQTINKKIYKENAFKIHPDNNKDPKCANTFQIFTAIKDKIKNNCDEIRKPDKNEMKPEEDEKKKHEAKDSEQNTQPKEAAADDQKKQQEKKAAAAAAAAAAADQKKQQEKKAAEDNLNNIRNNLIQFTKTVLIDANATVSLLNDVVYNLKIVSEYDEEKKNTIKSATKAVNKAVESATKAKDAITSVVNAIQTANSMSLNNKENKNKVVQINVQITESSTNIDNLLGNVQTVNNIIIQKQKQKENSNEQKGGTPPNDITIAVNTAIETAQNAIQSTETAIDSVNTLRKMISTNSELVLDSIQNSFLSEVFKFFTDNTADKVDTDDDKKFIESTELSTTYMYGELPTKKEIEECEKLEKEEEKEKCIYELQKKQNLLEEYTIQEKQEDGWMVPWSMENLLYMLSNTPSNISRYKQVYYKKDDTANPVYTHKVSKTVKKRIPVMEYDSDTDNPKNDVE